MKAIEYVEKYGEALVALHNVDLNKADIKDIRMARDKTEIAMQNIFADFCQEVRDMRDKRHIKSFSGILSVAKELNTKWNAVISTMEKKYGMCPLNRNAFLSDFKNGTVIGY